MDPSSPSSLEVQLNELRSRVYRLEEALRQQGIPVPPPPASAMQSPPQVREAVEQGLPVPPVPIAAGQPTPLPVLAASRPAGAGNKDRTLESRIGSQWFNRIGILAVLIGMSWFLKLAIDNHWIGPLGRVLIGLAAGAALIAWSEHFQRRHYAAFSYSLKAVGSGILYLSLWAAFSLFHLVPVGVASAAMVLVTAFNGFMAWHQDAELLALYSIVGGFSTPVLISTGGNHEVTLFSYLLLLDLAVLALVVLRPWSRLLFGAATGTVIFVGGWWFEYYSNAQFGQTAVFLGCFFLIFALAPRLVRVGDDSGADSSAPKPHSFWDTLSLEVLPIADAALTFLAGKAMIDQSAASTWADPWLAVAFAAFYLLLLRLPARGLLRSNSGLLSNLHLTFAIVFLTIAIPLQTHGRWLTIGWLMQGAILLWLAERVRSVLLRVLAVLCLILGLGALLLVNPVASITPILNERFATYCFAIAIFAAVAWIAAHARPDADDAASWPMIAIAAALTVNALILIAAGQEIHSYWWYVRWRGNWRLLHEYQMYAQFTYSACFMAFGAVLLGVGFWRRSAFVRWQALVLLAAAIGKVFLVDVSRLSQGYRILSFLGLGALLLGVSFVYQRDWLHLREASTEAQKQEERPAV